MTVQELIEMLEDLQEPDAEVRLAFQPSWPFEHEVGQVICVDLNRPDIDDLVEDEGYEPEEAEDAIRDYDLNGGGEENVVVYIGEAGQLGYLPGVVAGRLGWR